MRLNFLHVILLCPVGYVAVAIYVVQFAIIKLDPSRRIYIVFLFYSYNYSVSHTIFEFIMATFSS